MGTVMTQMVSVAYPEKIVGVIFIDEAGIRDRMFDGSAQKLPGEMLRLSLDTIQKWDGRRD
jgi:hypothetical protein